MQASFFVIQGGTRVLLLKRPHPEIDMMEDFYVFGLSQTSLAMSVKLCVQILYLDGTIKCSVQPGTFTGSSFYGEE